jgi:hypothetical protein
MNAIAAIMFLAFIAGGMTVNFIKDKEAEMKNPPPIVQVQPAPAPASGDTTATVNK